jgi:hypothetical protein
MCMILPTAKNATIPLLEIRVRPSLPSRLLTDEILKLDRKEVDPDNQLLALRCPRSTSEVCSGSSARRLSELIRGAKINHEYFAKAVIASSIVKGTERDLQKMTEDDRR